MANTTSNRGFAKMKKDDPARQRKLSEEGGHSQGKQNNPANFANRDSGDVRRTAKKGGES